MDLLTGIVILVAIAAAWDAVRRFTLNQATIARIDATLADHGQRFEGLPDNCEERIKSLELVAGGFKNAVENQKALMAKVAGRWQR